MSIVFSPTHYLTVPLGENKKKKKKNLKCIQANLTGQPETEIPKPVFKNILVTLVLYRKQLHLSSLSQTPALGICSAPVLYHKFLEGIHNSPNDVLLLSPKVNHIQQNSTQWAAILQCIIIVVVSHPRFKYVFTFQLQQQQQKTNPPLSTPRNT